MQIHPPLSSVYSPPLFCPSSLARRRATLSPHWYGYDRGGRVRLECEIGKGWADTMELFPSAGIKFPIARSHKETEPRVRAIRRMCSRRGYVRNEFRFFRGTGRRWWRDLIGTTERVWQIRQVGIFKGLGTLYKCSSRGGNNGNFFFPGGREGRGWSEPPLWYWVFILSWIRE